MAKFSGVQNDHGNGSKSGFGYWPYVRPVPEKSEKNKLRFFVVVEDN